MRQEESKEMTSVPPVYILTHGRPHFCEVNTIGALRRQKFAGKIVLVLDDEDSEIEEYGKLGCDVEVFSKKEMTAIGKKNCDTFLPHTGETYSSILYARQAAFEIAKRRGDRYFCTMDDDYEYFEIKCRLGDKSLKLYQPSDINEIMLMTYELLKTTNASVVAWGQNGDLLAHEIEFRNVRKAMNTLFFDTERSYDFVGLFDQDASAYVNLGRKGSLILTIPFILTKQHITQKFKGGLTEQYKKWGTYKKAMFCVMSCPSAVSVGVMGKYHFRIHHRIKWENCAPRILSADWEERMKDKERKATNAKLKPVQTKVSKFIS